MIKTALNITKEDMTLYRATARRREAQDREKWQQRRERAYQVAQGVANFLKAEFKAEQVILFGSLADDAFFHLRSDIDLAVVGIKPQDFWRAWAQLDPISDGFEIDLLDIETASPKLREEIERKGVSL